MNFRLFAFSLKHFSFCNPINVFLSFLILNSLIKSKLFWLQFLRIELKMQFPEARSGVFPFKIHVCLGVVSVATNQDTLRGNHVRSYASNIASVQDTVCDLFVL